MRPGTWAESETIVGYVEQQLAAIRYAAHGLTDEEARRRTTASALTVGGLVKHAAYVCRGWERRRSMAASGDYSLTEAARDEFVGSFALTEDESLAGALADLDRDASAYVAALRATDPGSTMTEPPAPWAGITEPTEITARFAMVHGIEELARHAGHADIIREQLDGASAPSLMLAAEGRPGNPFVQPWSRTDQPA